MSELEPNGYGEDRKLIFDRLTTMDGRVSRIEYGIVGILIAVILELFKGIL